MSAEFQKYSLVLAILGFSVSGTSPTEGASPTPISACPYSITAPGSYVVTRDLTIAGGCVGITADNVALDLQGHSITGDGVHGGGISGGGNHIVITNGTVARFDTGISLGGEFNTISGMTVNDNTGFNNGNLANGIILYGTANGSVNSVINSKAVGNTKVGIGCGSCISTPNVAGSGNSIVFGSQADSNGLGIYGFSMVVDSEATNNQSDGITLSNGFVTGANAKGNGGAGIVVNDNGSVIDSNASGNGADGINIGAGVRVGNGDGVGGVTGSTANNNGNHGIFLNCPTAAFGNTAQKNLGGNLGTSDNTCVLFGNKLSP